MKHTKQEYIDFFTHMEQEEIHNGPLDGQAWDEIDWWIHYAIDVDKVFAENKLKNMFPDLFRRKDTGNIGGWSINEDEEKKKIIDTLNSIPERYLVSAEEWQRIFDDLYKGGGCNG